MTKKIVKSNGVPGHSIITRNLTGRIDFIDSFSIEVAKERRSIDELTKQLFTSFPGWINALLNIRDIIVKPFGLMTGEEIKPQVSENPPYYQVGERAVVFKVIDRSDTEIVMAEDDKHLYFRTSLSLRKDVKPNWDELFLTTVVQFHNLGGRLYFAPVKPMHQLIMRSLLRNVSVSSAVS